MFKNYYKIIVSGRNIRRFIKMLYKLDISLVFIDIHDNFFYAKISGDNFEKLKNIKTSYEIKIVKKYGLIFYKEEFKKNIAFILCSCLGFIFVFLLSNIIFSVEIVHDDSNIRNTLIKELNKYNIKKYSLVKSYDYIQKVKKEILKSNQSSIEWMEIERVGTKYLVKLEERIINNSKPLDSFRHIVAKKSGIIKKIVASDGEIIKKINDYVNKDEIIISGNIHKGEDVKDSIAADGKVYAEVWYKVKVSLPINYYEEKLTGNNKYSINFSLLNYNIDIFSDNYLNKSIEKKIIYEDFFDMFTISFNNNKEKIVNESINLITSEKIAMNLAKQKILSKMDKEEYIISQKKLKTVLNNSTINVEIFFKVYENISSYKYFLNDEGLQ